MPKLNQILAIEKGIKTDTFQKLTEAHHHVKAQVEVYMEDVPVGRWRTVKMSGALPTSRITELLNRVEKLQNAVKFAREEANSLETTNMAISEKLFHYLFA